jgi:hypothetical protein
MLSLWTPLGQYCLTARVRDIRRCPVGVGTVIDLHLGHNTRQSEISLHNITTEFVWFQCLISFEVITKFKNLFLGVFEF